MRWLIFSHIYIGLCVVMMTLETIVLSGLNLYKSILYCSVAFFSTLIAYNLKGVKNEPPSDPDMESEKGSWARKNSPFILALVLVSAVGVLSGMFFLNKNTVYLLFPLGLFSLGYSWPIKIGKYVIVLRELLFIKTLLVALVWTVVVVCLPYVEYGMISAMDTTRIVSTFMFLLALALLFDIKDVEADKKTTIKTIPMMIGIDGTKLLSLVILLCRILYLVVMNIDPIQLLAESLTTVACFIFILKFINHKSSEYFYMFWIDGLMIVKSFLAILFYVSTYELLL